MRHWLRGWKVAGILFVFLCALLAMVAYTLSRPLLHNQNAFTITIKGKQPLVSLVDGLSQRGLVRYPQLLRHFLALLPLSDVLKAGEYRVTSGVSLYELIQQISRGHGIFYRFLIVEGTTTTQALSNLARSPLVTKKLATMTPMDQRRRYGFDMSTSEGQLFPDTYFFERGSSDLLIIDLAFEKMRQTLQQAWSQHATGLAYDTAQKALTVASLIEKETAIPEERALIAGVINNRLKKGMRLQVDPTVVYGLSLPYGTRVTYSMLKKDTPYNTYMHNGLPPSPICLPSKASILAAMHPASTDALYYVSTGEGRHQFSKTYKKHLRGVEKLRKKMREQHSFSPIFHTRIGWIETVLVYYGVVLSEPATSWNRWVVNDLESLLSQGNQQRKRA